MVRLSTQIGLMILFMFIYLPSRLLSQQEPGNLDEAFTFKASYLGDNVNNLAGGIKTGSCYLGLANFHLKFDTKKAGLWKGGQFYINAANTHGASPSAEFIGDLQVTSNIEAGNHTFIQEFWYKQALGCVDLTAGLQDLNVQFANTENGTLYLNSSFGILPTISGNIPAPIYPLTSLGFSVTWTVSEKISWNSAVYDGCPTDFDHNTYNLNWQYHTGDGLLAFSELDYSQNILNLPGNYKIGAYSHNHWFEKSGENRDMDSACINNYGIYAIADQMLWQKEKKSVGTFLQLGFGPTRYNQNYFYFGTGLNYHGLFKKNGNDILGLAFAVACLKGNINSETTLELTYKTELTKHLFIQPDIQYIINPAGIGTNLKNCLECTIRFGILI